MEFLSKSGLSFFKSLLDLYFATKSYVNKAISTNTGKFWGTFNDIADLQEITGSNGDYAYVIVPDDYSTSYDRYKWQDGQWVYEYTVGGEAFDDDQWAAINSGITSADKTRLNEISDNIGNNSISEMRSDIDANASEIKGINEELGDIDAALANKANVDGYYESMAVGQADNLKGQVLIPNDAAFRTSGGSEDVDTGLAHLQNLKGNTVSWNSLILNGNFDDLSYWRKYDSNVEISVSNNKLSANWTSPYSNNGVINTVFRYSAGHIYAVFATVKNTSENVRYYNIGQPYGAKLSSGALLSGEEKNIRGLIAISQSSGSGFDLFTVFGNFDVYNSLELSRVMIFDLTLIYGAGNEPTSVEQFEADYEKWFGKPLTYEPYNAGELIPAKTTAIKTTGFNQWDEEWESGTINTSNGYDISSSVQIRNPINKKIAVIPNTSYCIKWHVNASSGNFIYFYRADGTYIGYNNAASADFTVFTTPSDCAYLRFVAVNSESTYANDICLNLSWSGTRNGEYEPYESHTLQLPLTTLTGKLNGTGASVVVFPDGMKKAGSVQDEIYVSGGKTYAVKRVGSVDLGSLNFVKDAQDRMIGQPAINGVYYAVNIRPKIICSKYLTDTPTNTYTHVHDKAISYNSARNVVVYDSSYTDAASFKAAMQGVILYYELAIPLIYELDDFTLPATFRVNDLGTEEQIHAEGVASVPATLANVYAMNAVDTINHLREEVTEIEGDITEMQSDIDANTSEIESHATQLQVEAEGLTQAHYELSAFEQIAQGKDEAVLPTLKAQTIDADEWISYGAPRVLVSDADGAPSAANIPTNWDESTMDVWDGYPRFIGQQYIDKTNKKLYVALALTGSVNDWVLMN